MCSPFGHFRWPEGVDGLKVFPAPERPARRPWAQKQRNVRVNNLVDLHPPAEHGCTVCTWGLPRGAALPALREGKALRDAGGPERPPCSEFCPVLRRPAATHRGPALVCAEIARAAHLSWPSFRREDETYDAWNGRRGLLRPARVHSPKTSANDAPTRGRPGAVVRKHPEPLALAAQTAGSIPTTISNTIRIMVTPTGGVDAGITRTHDA